MFRPSQAEIPTDSKANGSDKRRLKADILAPGFMHLNVHESEDRARTSVPRLNLDILYDIVAEVARFDSNDSRAILLSLTLSCRTVNDSIRPILFSKVHWPHPNKHDASTGLLFFPEALWPYFRTFHFDWPDHWPDASPPRWGEKPGVSVYYPKHLDKLEDAVPRMHNIHTFQLTCPFDPPTRLLRSLVCCTNITDLRITDTPLTTPILPASPPGFNLKRLTLTSVAEAVRMGEGPYDQRYQNIAYFMRGYRKKYLDRSGELTGTVGSVMFAAQRFFTTLCLTDCLQYLQLSALFIGVKELWNADWPCLQTLVLTGPPPAAFYDLAALVGRMPRLEDLRVLLSTTGYAETRPERGPFAMLAPAKGAAPVSAAAYGQLTALALSNAFNTKGVLKHTPSLRRLAVCAIMSPPRKPIALGRPQMEELMAELEAGGGGENLVQIRLISEVDLDPNFFGRLQRVCPKLEVVEIERCGYQEAQDPAEWDDYGNVFATYEHLRELRVPMPFQGCEELGHEHAQMNNNNPACTRAFRKPCASYLASRIPSLRRVGMEYRARTVQRYEDRWLDFDIVRLHGGAHRVVELGPSWYQFPEVWASTTLHE